MAGQRAETAAGRAVPMAGAALLLLLAALAVPGAADKGGSEEKWLLANYVEGPLDASPSSPQWDGTFRTVIERGKEGQGGESHIELAALANRTDLLLRLSWEDPARDATDGAAVFFEGAEESPWSWSPAAAQGGPGAGVVSAAEWKEGRWTVFLGRRLVLESSPVVFRREEPMRDFVKVAVWDGGSGGKIGDFDPEGLEHINLLLLPRMDSQTVDTLVAGGFLLFMAVYFAYAEIQRHKKGVP